MIIADYHVHSRYSMDSDEPMSESIERAMKLGIKDIVFTDHFEVFHRNEKLENVIDYDKYTKELSILRNKHKEKIRIGLGAEINLEIGMEDSYNRIMSRYDFDFIIGSLHNVDYIDISQRPFIGDSKLDEYHSKYFAAMLKAVDCDFPYSVLGHLDFVTRYGGFRNNIVNVEAQSEYLVPILKTVIEKGKGIEVNTSGFRYGVGSMHPSVDILSLYKKLGGEIITVGSDSHQAETIGMHFDHVEKVLIDLGFKYYTAFDKMVPEFVKLG